MAIRKRPQGVRTWIEISTNALENNYNQFRQLIPKQCKLMAICKSNAYGHGLVDYAKEMQKLGADFIGVDSITEALPLRKKGIEIPILVLGYTLPEMVKKAIDNNISLTVSSLDYLSVLRNVIPAHSTGSGQAPSGIQNKNLNPRIKSEDDVFKKLKIHLKIDSGMHRQGLYLEEIEKAVKFIQNHTIELEGIYTHFAAAKNPAFPEHTLTQLNYFNKACDKIVHSGLRPIKHAAATSGTLLFPDSHLDMVRIGIGLMGLWPSLQTKAFCEKTVHLIPALAWKSIVSEIKTVQAGESVGYDFTEKFLKDTKIGIIPIGYWHGYRRNLTSIGQVLINGQKAKVLGRVSMDMIVIDLSEVESEVGGEATLIGSNYLNEISAEEMSILSETSWYEIITQINPLIKRVYV